MSASLVGSEMCIRDSYCGALRATGPELMPTADVAVKTRSPAHGPLPRGSSKPFSSISSGHALNLSPVL
eukprot:12206453-Alexandrium_andersonii.AAC.1